MTPGTLRRLAAALVGALFLSLGLVACGREAAPVASDAAAAGGFPRTVTDGAGRKVRLAARPVRIVSQTLASDEMLFAMVAPARLVGLSPVVRDLKYSNVVAEATAHPAPGIESAEDALRLKPDLVVVASYSRAEVVSLLESTGAPIYRLSNRDDLEGVMANIRALGEAVGEEAAAERVIAGMQNRLAAIARRRAGHPRPRVLSYSGGFTAGKGTSFDDIVARAGGVNEAAARGIESFPKLSAEQVLAWNPDVIVSGYLPGEIDNVRRHLTTSAGVAQTTAARRQQIILIETRRYLAVSQYMVDAVEQIADSLDAFESAR